MLKSHVQRPDGGEQEGGERACEGGEEVRRVEEPDGRGREQMLRRQEGPVRLRRQRRIHRQALQERPRGRSQLLGPEGARLQPPVEIRGKTGLLNIPTGRATNRRRIFCPQCLGRGARVLCTLLYMHILITRAITA